MKTNKLLPAVVLSLLTAPGCTGDKGNPPENCEEVAKKIEYAHSDRSAPIYIILCDFSASLDTSSLRSVQEQPLQIFDRYYKKADIQFYSITGGSSVPFYQSSPPLIDTAKLSMPDLNKFKRCQKASRDEERSRLAQALDQQSKTRPRETRIIQAVEGAFNVLRQTASCSAGTANKVFVLSDMLEFGASSLGEFNLEDHEYEADIADLEKTAYASSSDLKQNIEVQIGFYTQRVEKLDQFAFFWNRVFQRLGYHRPIVLSSKLRLQ